MRRNERCAGRRIASNLACVMDPWVERLVIWAARVRVWLALAVQTCPHSEPDPYQTSGTPSPVRHSSAEKSVQCSGFPFPRSRPAPTVTPDEMPESAKRGRRQAATGRSMDSQLGGQQCVVVAVAVAIHSDRSQMTGQATSNVQQ